LNIAIPPVAEAPAEAANSSSRPAVLRSVICDSARRICINVFGDRLKAVVLAGSLARDEATFARSARKYIGLGDAEFMVVLMKGLTLPKAASLRALREQIEEDLLRQGILCKIELSAVPPDYFRRLPPHIFSYELKHCGRVIWGDEDVLRAIPGISATDLSREDAARLLCNRLVELLECAPELFNGRDSISAKLHYKLVKLYLDMATSFLAYLGCYAPTYRERAQILTRLAIQRAGTARDPVEIVPFAKLVADCTHWKLAQHEECEAWPDVSWREAVQCAHSLWRWELIDLTGSPESITDDELFRAWKRSQSRKANLRGWARVFRLCGWRRGCRQWMRWLRLSWETGPRFGVYVAAFELLFHASSLPSGTLNHTEAGLDICDLRRLLPVAGQREGKSESNGAHALAAAIVSNYQEFLTGTRT
jgi:hypothetical protein